MVLGNIENWTEGMSLFFYFYLYDLWPMCVLRDLTQIWRGSSQYMRHMVHFNFCSNKGQQSVSLTKIGIALILFACRNCKLLNRPWSLLCILSQQYFQRLIPYCSPCFLRVMHMAKHGTLVWSCTAFVGCCTGSIGHLMYRDIVP